MTQPVIHRVTTLDLAFEPWSWPFAAERRAEIDAHFARQAAREADLERPRPAGARSGFRRRAPARQLFRDRFRQLPGVARLGLSRRQLSSTASAWARCALPTAPSCSAKWASTPRMPAASIFRRERPISTISAGTRSISPAASPAKSWRKPGWRLSDYRAAAHWDCVVSGRAIAMIRILDVDLTGEALRARIEANLAGQRQPELSAIHLVRGRGDLTAAMPRFVAAFVEKHMNS